MKRQGHSVTRKKTKIDAPAAPAGQNFRGRRLKSCQDIGRIRESAALLRETLGMLRRHVGPGVTTRQLNDIAADHLAACGARPSFFGYMDYPAAMCISINDEVIHGIPGKRRLRDGDLVGLDLGVEIDGYFADAALTVPVGRISVELQRLLDTTRECLRLGIAQAVAGNRVRDVSRAIYHHARNADYGVVRQFCGHGLGFAVHEDPQVPNYPGSGENPRLKPGMVLAVEPMLNAGTGEISVLADGWTVVTGDGLPSAHFEHTIAIFKDRTEVLTA
jgi:methionyl aminopeptidase